MEGEGFECHLQLILDCIRFQSQARLINRMSVLCDAAPTMFSAFSLLFGQRFSRRLQRALFLLDFFLLFNLLFPSFSN